MEWYDVALSLKSFFKLIELKKACEHVNCNKAGATMKPAALFNQFFFFFFTNFRSHSKLVEQFKLCNK